MRYIGDLTSKSLQKPQSFSYGRSDPLNPFSPLKELQPECDKSRGLSYQSIVTTPKQYTPLSEEFKELFKAIHHPKKQKGAISKTSKSKHDGYLLSMREIGCVQESTVKF